MQEITMTMRQLMEQALGREAFHKLSPYSKAMIRKIDRLPPLTPPKKRRPA